MSPMQNSFVISIVMIFEDLWLSMDGDLSKKRKSDFVRVLKYHNRKLTEILKNKTRILAFFEFRNVTGNRKQDIASQPVNYFKISSCM